ncbi:hypothetical protein ACOMHN_048592 [Nucella lapillus]
MRDKNVVVELALRFVLFVIFTITDDAEPWHRVLQPEELWLYRYPHIPDIYPGKLMWITVFAVPTVIFVGFYLLRRDSEDLIRATLGVTLSIYIAGCITNIVKLAVGRPRPDFLSRCYPQGLPDTIDFTYTVACPGNHQLVLNGLKSFPSSHSSLSFASLVFVALYVAGKLRVFNDSRGKGWRFVAFLLPLLWALMIAITRTSDYHHHWQDVTVGSIIGIVVGYACYHQVYPCLCSVNSHLCRTQIPSGSDTPNASMSDSLISVSSPQSASPQTNMTLISKLI